MNEILYSCRKAAELITRSQDERLGLLDRVRLKVHLSMCGNCANVDRQISQMSKMMRETEPAEAPTD